jgi:hypothetical protein
MSLKKMKITTKRNIKNYSFDFMINEEQIIDKAYYGKDFGDHIPMNDVLEWKVN